MKLKNVIALTLLVVSVHALAQNSGEMQRMSNGLQYKIFTSNNGAKIKLNDVVSFNVIEKTDKDSVLSNSFTSGQPASIFIQPSKSSLDLMDFFQLLSVQDSAMVKIPSDSLFADTTRMQRPPFFPEGSFLNLIVKIEKVQSEEEVKAEQQKMMDTYKKAMDSLKANELTSINKYIADNKLVLKQTPSGLQYTITTPSLKGRPLAGDTVFVNYTGRTLEGKVFDSSIEAEAKRAGLEQPGRQYEPISLAVGQGEVIKGWDEGLLLLNEGSKATFLIPSELAYGQQGAGADIKPFSPLVFDIELVKVKHAKKAPVITKKPAVSSAKSKTPVKRAPVKKAAPTGVKPKAGTISTSKK